MSRRLAFAEFLFCSHKFTHRFLAICLSINACPYFELVQSKELEVHDWERNKVAILDVVHVIVNRKSDVESEVSGLSTVTGTDFLG